MPQLFFWNGEMKHVNWILLLDMRVCIPLQISRFQHYRVIEGVWVGDVVYFVKHVFPWALFRRWINVLKEGRKISEWIIK